MPLSSTAQPVNATSPATVASGAGVSMVPIGTSAATGDAMRVAMTCWQTRQKGTLSARILQSVLGPVGSAVVVVRALEKADSPHRYRAWTAVH